MDKSSKQISIVISPPGGSSIKISVSTLALKITAALAGVVVLVLLFGVGQIGHLYRKVVLYQDIINENRRLRRQNELLTSVESEMKELDAAEKEARSMLAGPLPGGMDEAIAAIGGDSVFDAMVEKQLAAESDSLLLWPNDGPLTRGFEPGLHAGIDIAGEVGSPVRAAAAGTVVFAGWDDELGNLVTLDHGGGLSTKYGHNERIEVKVGQAVTRGETIARLGNSGVSSGPHVHFECTRDGVPVAPLGLLRHR